MLFRRGSTKPRSQKTTPEVSQSSFLFLSTHISASSFHILDVTTASISVNITNAAVAVAFGRRRSFCFIPSCLTNSSHSGVTCQRLHYFHSTSSRSNSIIAHFAIVQSGHHAVSDDAVSNDVCLRHRETCTDISDRSDNSIATTEFRWLLSLWNLDTIHRSRHCDS